MGDEDGTIATASNHGPSDATTRSVPKVVEPDDPTGVALEILEKAELPFLPVRGKDSGRCVGVVLRKALVNGCRGMGHDPDGCPVSRHLYTNIDRVRQQDAFGSGGEDESAGRRPTVLVDEDGAPTSIVAGSS